jgi:predicted lactoylglutathione lyase
VSISPFSVRRTEIAANNNLGERVAKKSFVNMAVRDLKKSMDFFGKLGFTFNVQFTGEAAACMIVSEDIYVMLLTENKFKSFTPKQVCDATKSTEVLVCLSAASRNEVNELVRKAVALHWAP